MKYGTVNLGQVEALINKLGGESAIARVLSGEWIVGEPASIKKRNTAASKKVLAGLLEPYGEAASMPANERFVARDKFVIDRAGELPISYLGDNFRNNFLDVIEENTKATTLKQRKLLKDSVDGPILSALGGARKAKIALASVFDFLKTADRTKWYLFYVADAKGTVWAVDARWSGDGWYVNARSVTDPYEWRADRVVVSR